MLWINHRPPRYPRPQESNLCSNIANATLTPDTHGRSGLQQDPGPWPHRLSRPRTQLIGDVIGCIANDQTL